MAANRRDILKPFEDNRDYMSYRIQSGIENNRKGFAQMHFADKNGNPLSGVRVNVKQKSHEFKYGANLFMLDELESDEKNALYKQYFKDTFNLATVPFYWNGLEPAEGKPRYAKDSEKLYRRPAPDLCLDYCEQNGITPKAHCLTYDQWSPDWLKNNVDEIKRKLNQRYRELADRYAHRIPQWEVTNETLLTNGKTVFFNEPDIVEWSFEQAKKYFPLNDLLINETQHMVWSVLNGNRSQYYMQIERALRNGARVDSIGFQYHMFHRAEDEARETAVYYDPNVIYGVLDRYADFQKPMQITEMTIPCYSKLAEDEDIQAEIIKNVYSIFFSHEYMEGIVYWNLVDGYAAFAEQGDMTSGENYYHGGLVRFDFTPKPAFQVIQKLFNEEWRTNEALRSGDNGTARFRGFYGEYDLEIVHDGEKINRPIHFSKKGAANFHIVL